MILAEIPTYHTFVTEVNLYRLAVLQYLLCLTFKETGRLLLWLQECVVSRQTLFGHVHGKVHQYKQGPSTTLDEVEEKALATYLEELSYCGFPFT